MTDDTLEALRALRETARATALTLFRGPCTNHADGNPCLEKERMRALTKAERDRLGGTIRGFYLYDATRMCRGCALYWHAECAALLLDEAVAMRALVDEEDRRKALDAQRAPVKP